LKAKRNILIILSLIVVVTLITIFSLDNKPSLESFAFFNEEVRLHNEYRVKLVNVNQSDSAFILDENNQYVRLNEEHRIYVFVTILIFRDSISPNNEEIDLSVNNFQLRDYHKIGLEETTVLKSLYDSRMSLDKRTFEDNEPIVDYSWFNKGINLWGMREITLCFMANYSYRDTLMELYIDFFNDTNNTGKSIILAERP
jgi:hypothetical protein